MWHGNLTLLDCYHAKSKAHPLRKVNNMGLAGMSVDPTPHAQLGQTSAPQYNAPLAAASARGTDALGPRPSSSESGRQLRSSSVTIGSP